ncbi:MAG: hypothetical protein KDJ14_17435 [Xanthomonadales bacterium]|nr:hypothetical protein [Xanthomonadales bacterium]
MSDMLSEKLAKFHGLVLSASSDLGKVFGKGMSRAQIAKSVRLTGIGLPESHFPLFERFNGQKQSGLPVLPCPHRKWGGLKMCSLSLMEEWRDALIGSEWMYQNCGIGRELSSSERVRSEFWSPSWLPIAAGETLFRKERRAVNTELFLDFEPAVGGSRGQVVYQEVERVVSADKISPENCTRTVIADSIVDYFEGLISMMELGRIGFQGGKGIAWR